jgi:hypothetical protein
MRLGGVNPVLQLRRRAVQTVRVPAEHHVHLTGSYSGYQRLITGAGLPRVCADVVVGVDGNHGSVESGGQLEAVLLLALDPKPGTHAVTGDPAVDPGTKHRHR